MEVEEEGMLCSLANLLCMTEVEHMEHGRDGEVERSFGTRFFSKALRSYYNNIISL